MNDSIISIDYSELEQRVSNSLTGDLNMNIDQHKEMASEMFNVPYDEVTLEQRFKAKELAYINNYSYTGGKV